MEKVSKKAINYWRLQAVFKTVISLTVIIVGLVLIYFFPFIKIPAFVVIGIEVVFFLYEVVGTEADRSTDQRYTKDELPEAT